MVRTYRLESLADALDIATTLTHSWFRGQPVEGRELLPRLFRRENHDPMRTLIRPDLELSKIETFKRHAALLADVRLPSDHDRLGWLSVMQHYRCPTRLLDWTENLLVALYFTVSANPCNNGELWAILPWALNEAAGAGRAIPLPGSPQLQYLLQCPYWNDNGALAASLGLASPVECPLALELPLRFPRMVVQHSAFTIHPRPEDTTSIANALPDPKYLVRYVVPASSKRQLLKGLRALGLSQRHLFPDLEGLSEMIQYDDHELQYRPPEPPVCSGEIGPDQETSTA